jgi:S1-C subfamily serine protease
MGLSTNGANYMFEKVVFVAPDADLAILKFLAVDVPYLRLGSFKEAVEGERILVIGNPNGLQGTVSDGLIQPSERIVHTCKLLLPFRRAPAVPRY